MPTAFKNVDEYIATFPPATQTLLLKVRNLVLHNAPATTESISYGMPAYHLHGKPLAYFAGYKNHIGFYATPSGQRAFQKELGKYKQGKGSVQFPLDEPLPLPLIAKMIRFKAKENLMKSKSKSK